MSIWWILLHYLFNGLIVGILSLLSMKITSLIRQRLDRFGFGIMAVMGFLLAYTASSIRIRVTGSNPALSSPLWSRFLQGLLVGTLQMVSFYVTHLIWPRRRFGIWAVVGTFVLACVAICGWVNTTSWTKRGGGRVR